MFKQFHYFSFIDYHAKEEMVEDQFLLGTQELSVQVAAHGCRRVEDIVRVSRWLEFSKKKKSVILDDPNPACKRALSQMSTTSRPTPNSW